MQEIKDLKKAYRLLRVAKRNKDKGPERSEITKKMKEIKMQIEALSGKSGVSDKKSDLVNKIYDLDPSMKGRVNLYSHSEEDLEFHYLKKTGKVKTRQEYNEKYKKPEPATVGVGPDVAAAVDAAISTKVRRK
jgi:predicted metal-dependent RNase